MNETLNGYISTLFRWLGLTGQSTLVILLYQLVALLLVALLAWLAYIACRRIFMPMMQKLTSHTTAKWDDYLFNKRVLLSICRLVPAIVIFMLLPLIFSKEMHDTEEHLLYKLLYRASAIYVIAEAMKLICVFFDGIKAAAAGREQATNHYMTAIFQVMKIVVWFIGIICIVSVLIDKSPVTLFAGLGAAATILMLVFKDTIVGLVAGIQLSVNDMLHVGDWIQMDKAGINGVVEEITLTTVKIRNYDNTVTTIPPYTLVSETFQNWKGMLEGEGRRVTFTLYIDVNSIGFCSPAVKKTLIENGYAREEDFGQEMVNLTLFRKCMEDYLNGLREVNASQTHFVHQLAPTTRGIPVEFYFFLNEKEWIAYEHISDEMIEHVIAIVPLFGLSIFQEPSGLDFKGLK
jgi:miniconductance mechanosensitive channel